MGMFDEYRRKAWPYHYAGLLHCETIAGGTPSHPDIATGFIKTKLGVTDADQIRDMVATLMVDRGITMEEAAEEAALLKNLTGFKRDEQGLYIEGRHLKAALREMVNAAVAVGKLKKLGWGATSKGAASFFAEHIMVDERRLHLGVEVATGVGLHFVHKTSATGPIHAISLKEYVEDVDVAFHLTADYAFEWDDLMMAWMTGEKQGLGAGRSQGYGQYELIAFAPEEAAA